MNWSNPLHHPLAILAGGIVLVVSVRLLALPSAIALPASAAIAIGGAQLLGWRQPQRAKTLLASELQVLQAVARDLAAKAESLRQEASRLLASGSGQLELLTAVEYVCDRAQELPEKVAKMTERLQDNDSLLSITALQQQLLEVQARQQRSTGAAQQQLVQLAASLQRNIELAQQGEDARQAQAIALSTLMTDSAGALQTLQNRLRTANLADATALVELRSLSEELSGFQESMELLVSR
ncbi:MAG: hypothetical protein HC838_09455 [Spirulinaceae cyanobacterium RM2_2_10]|nr:hypothetical protein [Spirulinaceae cyanobacterium SM2_1_0]NJO20223.1 hypothetical protein [Spirulinaceae cyanobacterium RM2_2_10]